MRHSRWLATVLLLAACGGGDGTPADPTPTPRRGTDSPDASATPDESGASTPPTGEPFYDEVSAAAGIDFVHYHGGQGVKNFIETMGGGAVLFDYDGDADLDAYLVQSGDLPGDSNDGRDRRSHLYQNAGDGTFAKVTERAGIDNPGAYGMGASAADYDGDGWIDLYVLNFEDNRLYRNRGDGTFEDVTAVAGVADPLWSVSAAWADFDNDGLLDLYVVNYLNFTMDTNTWCGRKSENIRAYCHPDQYDGVQPRLYINNGDGTFADRTVEAGVQAVHGKGLGVVAADFDNDGDIDMFGANDSTENYVWVNNGDGTFDDLAVLSGAALNEDGKVQACMGVDAGDFDGDGLLDVYTTNLDLEYNTLYKNTGDLGFIDATFQSGVADVHLLMVGFGTEFLDYDLDGWLDIFVANGHIIDNITEMNDSMLYEQPKSLFHNLGNGKFEETGRRMPDMGEHRVSRGLAVGDIDADGDLDVLIGNNDEPAQLFRNDGVGHGSFLSIETQGRASNRHGIGARLTLHAGGHQQMDEVRAGTSYASSGDPRVTFGLGDATAVDWLEVRWPSGAVQRFEGLPVRAWIRVVEGADAVEVLRTADAS